MYLKSLVKGFGNLIESFLFFSHWVLTAQMRPSWAIAAVLAKGLLCW